MSGRRPSSSIHKSIENTNRSIARTFGTITTASDENSQRHGQAENPNSKRPGEALTSSLSTVFVIVYLQEAAWICAPLIISLNILLHSFFRSLGGERVLYICAFGFFSMTSLATLLGLWCIHNRALARLQQAYLLPFFITKLFRMCVLMTVAVYICIDTERRRWYFYVSLYAVFESLAGVVVLEIVYRSWKYLRRAKKAQRKPEIEVLWREPRTSSLRSSQSIP